MGGAEAGRGSGGARGTGAASLRQEVAGRGTQGQVGAEGEGEAGGGPASYRARPAAAGLVVVAREALVGGGAAAAAWLRGRWGSSASWAVDSTRSNDRLLTGQSAKMLQDVNGSSNMP